MDRERQICDVLYATANSAFVLSCAKEGCRGHLCYDCMQRAVFPGNSSGATCPHCRRAVTGYAYAFFPTFKSLSKFQDRITQLETKVSRLNKNIALAKADSEAATRRVDEWCRWATAAKSSISNMPPSSMPTVVVSPQLDLESARSRSPRRVGVGEYNG